MRGSLAQLNRWKHSTERRLMTVVKSIERAGKAGHQSCCFEKREKSKIRGLWVDNWPMDHGAEGAVVQLHLHLQAWEPPLILHCARPRYLPVQVVLEYIVH